MVIPAHSKRTGATRKKYTPGYRESQGGSKLGAILRYKAQSPIRISRIAGANPAYRQSLTRFAEIL